MPTPLKSSRKSMSKEKAVPKATTEVEPRMPLDMFLASRYDLSEVIRAGFVASLQGKTFMRRSQFEAKLNSYIKGNEV